MLHRSIIVPPRCQAAESHLTATLYCSLSGYFSGSYTGDRGGTVAFLADPVTGRILASAPGVLPQFESGGGISADSARTFNAVATDGSGDNPEGRFDSYDEISGVWAIGPDSGEFTASRIAADPGATYRFTGQWFRDVVYPGLPL